MSLVIPSEEFRKLEEDNIGQAIEAANLIANEVYGLGLLKPELLGLAEEIADQHTIVAINEINEVEAVGSMTLCKAIGKAAITELAVAKHRQGQGLGSLLLSRLEDDARNLDMTIVELIPVYSARDFYKKLGYIPIGGSDYWQKELF